MSKLLIQPYCSVAEELTLQVPKITSTLNKIRKTLRSYALSKNKQLGGLLILDICGEKDSRQINSSLIRFLKKSLGTRYAQETRSRIKQFINTMHDAAEGVNQESSSSTLKIPAFLQKAVAALPHQNIKSVPNEDRTYRHHENNDHRLSLPLTKNGQDVLVILLQVVEEYAISSLDSLFNEYGSEVRRKLRENPFKNRRLVTYLYELKIKLGFKVLKTIPKAKFGLKNFPPLLRSQCETFIENASMGLDADGRLTSTAQAYNISIAKLSKITIDGYLKQIGHVLKNFEYEEYDKLEIRSFLKITAETRIGEDNRENIFLFNPLVERYRESEKNRQTYAKRIGFDSYGFNIFSAAIKAVAAFNKIFIYHASFNTAYKINLDRNSIETRKKSKKRTFDRVWLDSEIVRLSKRFFEVVKKKAFMTRGPTRIYEARDNLRFCLFFVILVTLRFGGHRQQSLRNCEIGKNVVFNQDQSIVFHWLENETKNKVELITVLDPVIYKKTIGLFIETLNIYYRKIYPYLSKNSETGLENQLFCRLTRQGKCKRFDAFRAGSFSITFINWCSMYINFEGRSLPSYKSLAPHFFRGICTDWLYYDMRVSIENIAEYIGDTVQTLQNKYLNKNEPRRANKALDQASYNLKIFDRDSSSFTESKDALIRILDNEIGQRRQLQTRIKELEEELKRTRGA